MRILVPVFLFALAIGGSAAQAQRFEFPRAATDDAGLARELPALAKRIIPVYAEPDTANYLGNLFRLQMVAGDYAAAGSTLQKLRALHAAQAPDDPQVSLAPDEIAAGALRRIAGGLSPEESTAAAFRELFGRLDDKTASGAIYWLWGPVGRFHDAAAGIAARNAPAGSIDLAEALDLIRNYQLYDEYRNLIPLTDGLIREDDARRYLIERDVPVRTPEGATICVLVVRPRAAGAQPTALNFSIYADPVSIDKARIAAAHGFAGVVAAARGKACSNDEIVPWEVEARDTYGLIDWISKQPWSDGRVGMYGGSYEGFAQWAAVKHVHPALKTIVPWAAVHPGLVLPMSNNVFQNANYQWASYVTNNRYLDEQANHDQARWDGLNRRWYESGKPYRDIDAIDGAPNKLLQRQLRHPAFDGYWQSMTPGGREFAKIGIPVLQIAGYFDPAQVAGLHYLSEHYRYDAKAEHYLIIGPYDHYGAMSPQKSWFVSGYAIDPAAQVDTVEITYQWFDHIFKGAPKPALLQDRINYEVMGANTWQHAASTRAMSNGALKLYLSGVKTADRYRLARAKPAAGFLEQTVDFADRTDPAANNVYPAGVVVKNLDPLNGFTFISEPVGEALSVAGAISGTIRAAINKKDMDVALAFYEVTPEGDYFNLGYYLGRASFSQDPRIRRLLKPGKIESIQIRGESLMSRQLRPESRLLVQLTVNKNRYTQINYGSGKDVSDESMSDATEPLRVRWQNDSFISVPVRR